jgi:aminopeptidase N
LLRHAIRLTVGEATFVAILRTWTARFAHSGVTTADFVAVANEVSGRDLDTLFDDWLRDYALPALPEPRRSPRR